MSKINAWSKRNKVGFKEAKSKNHANFKEEKEGRCRN